MSCPHQISYYLYRDGELRTRRDSLEAWNSYGEQEEKPSKSVECVKRRKKLISPNPVERETRDRQKLPLSTIQLNSLVLNSCVSKESHQEQTYIHSGSREGEGSKAGCQGSCHPGKDRTSEPCKMPFWGLARLSSQEQEGVRSQGSGKTEGPGGMRSFLHRHCFPPELWREGEEQEEPGEDEGSLGEPPYPVTEGGSVAEEDKSVPLSCLVCRLPQESLCPVMWASHPAPHH